MTYCQSGLSRFVVKHNSGGEKEENGPSTAHFKMNSHLCKIASDVVDGSVSKAVAGSKWEEKQQ